MADSGFDPSAPARGEQPLYTPVSGHTAPSQRSAPDDGPGPSYTAPYPPYPYDPPVPSRLGKNTAAGLAYFTVIPAVFFLLLEPYRDSTVLRFHSWQSIFLFISFAVVRLIEKILGAMLPSAVAYSISGMCWMLFFVAWLVATVKAFQGDRYSLPVIGTYAESTAATPSGR